MPKRNDYISWQSYFMSLAFISSLRSKDPSSNIGACIVNPKNNRVISLGYNGFPAGCSDDEFPWERNAETPDKTKYPYVVHAEANAILNTNQDLNNCDLYLYSEKGFLPCPECTKIIIQKGISCIYLLYADMNADSIFSWESSRKMMDAVSMEIKYIGDDIKKDIGHIESKFINLNTMLAWHGRKPAEEIISEHP